MYKIKTKEGWVEGIPSNGDLVREYFTDKHYSEYIYNILIKPEPKTVKINTVEGAVVKGENVYAKELTDFTISGSLDIADQTFITPIKAVNPVTSTVSNVLYVPVEIVSGRFTITLSLTRGKYVLDDEILNAEFDYPKYSVTPVNIFITV